MDKGVKELIKGIADTMLNIAKMEQYRMKYAEKRDARDKDSTTVLGRAMRQSRAGAIDRP